MITFRRLNAEEFDAAYAIIREVTEWMLERGILQWERAFPVERYRERHEDGRNYGLFVGDELAVIGSLMGLGQLAASSELTALRSLGLSRRRLGLAVALALSVREMASLEAVPFVYFQF